MPVATKEFILNYSTNRWKLNQKRNVGKTSDSIRICAPNSCNDWKNYYYKNIYSADHISNLGRTLFVKIKTYLPQEKRFHPELVASITEQDCIDYMHTLVTERVYNGYIKEHGGK